jgi:hypothetical protein
MVLERSHWIMQTRRLASLKRRVERAETPSRMPDVRFISELIDSWESGDLSRTLFQWSWCADSTAVPMIASHGAGDRIAPYEAGKVWIAPDPVPPVRTWAAN